MNNRYVLFPTILVLFFLAGCASVPHEDIHMSLLKNVESGNYTLQTDHFGPGETPSVVVLGCGGRNVTIRIYNLDSGNLVATYKEYVPENWIKWWWFDNLPSGSYQAVLLVGGETKGAANFTISK